MADPPRMPQRRPAPALGSDNRSPGTPRRHKTPYRKSTQSTKPRTTLFTRERVKADLKEKLSLALEPDDWQTEVISRALRGYDGILSSGTGYGKSLIFQGLAKLSGDNKAIIVIFPLKALEADQVSGLLFRYSMTHCALGQGSRGEGRPRGHDQRAELEDQTGIGREQ